jgi:hypothetical protein
VRKLLQMVNMPQKGNTKEKKAKKKERIFEMSSFCEEEKVSIPDFGRYYYFFLPVILMIDFSICYFWLF